MLFACFIGCLAAGLLGLLAALKFDSPFLAFLAAGLLPAVACFWVGLRDQTMLLKIVMYASVGWTVTFLLAPQIGQSSDLLARQIAASPLVGREWLIPSSVASSLLAMVGAAFIPTENLAKRRSPGTRIAPGCPEDEG